MYLLLAILTPTLVHIIAVMFVTIAVVVGITESLVWLPVWALQSMSTPPR